MIRPSSRCVVEHDVGFLAPTLAERDRQRFHRITTVYAPTVAALVAFLRRLCRQWPAGEETLLVAVRFADGAERAGTAERRRLWRAANRAWRIGVRVASCGAVADNLLGTDPYA